VEEQYYMIWPLIIWLVRDERKIMRTCIVLMACGILLRINLLLLTPRGFASSFINMQLPTHWDGLLLGSWLALAVRRWPVQLLLAKTRWVVVLAFILLLAVGGYARSLDHDSPAMEIAGFTLVPIVFGGLLLRCLVSGSRASRIFSLGPMRFLGRYSYGIYVYHILFLPSMREGLHWLQAHLHSRVIASLVFVFLWAGGAVVVAMVSYKYFELPFLRLKKRFAPTPRTLPPAQASA
jgi:peptidoglycan/LPS O-acetylase OafA/YrhL